MQEQRHNIASTRDTSSRLMDNLFKIFALTIDDGSDEG
jgi:hypothetical protein